MDVLVSPKNKRKGRRKKTRRRVSCNWIKRKKEKRRSGDPHDDTAWGGRFNFIRRKGEKKKRVLLAQKKEKGGANVLAKKTDAHGTPEGSVCFIVRRLVLQGKGKTESTSRGVGGGGGGAEKT